MATIQQPTLNGFNNSVITGEYRLDAHKMSDTNHLYSIYRQFPETTYLGMMALWNQRRLMNTPLLNLAELSKSVIYVNGMGGQRMMYSIPYDIGLPYIVEDLTTELDKPGIDGQKFKIKLSEDCFTNTDVITFDYRDGISLFITDEEIYQEGDGYVYTVMIPQRFDNRTQWFPKKFLAPGTEFMKLGNVNGEFSTQKSTVWMREGILDLELQIAPEHRSVYHWITGYADMLKLKDGDPKLDWINQYGNLKEVGSVMTFFKKGANGAPIPDSLSWMTKIEALLWAEMKMMEERSLMWSKGGVVYGSGRTPSRLGVGLYEQLRNGNRITYNNLSLELIEEALVNLYYNSGVPYEQRRTVIQTGTAAMIEISRLLADDFKNSNPFFVDGTKINNYLYGDAMNLGWGYRFTSKRWAIAGTVEFELNPALDSRNGRAQDRTIGEWPLESYTLMILDVTDPRSTNAAQKIKGVDYRVDSGFNNGPNIALIKPEGYADTYWGYEVGTQSPFGPNAMKGMISSSQRDGYAIWMKNFSSIWVKDATRTMIMEKARPMY